VAFVWAFLQYHLLSTSRPTFFLSSGWIPSSYNHSLILPSPHISVLVESYTNCNITTRYVRASLVRVEPTTRHHKTLPETEKWNIQEYKVFSNTFLLRSIPSIGQFRHIESYHLPSQFSNHTNGYSTTSTAFRRHRQYPSTGTRFHEESTEWYGSTIDK
jgi:hypothetical protein